MPGMTQALHWTVLLMYWHHNCLVSRKLSWLHWLVWLATVGCFWTPAMWWSAIRGSLHHHQVAHSGYSPVLLTRADNLIFTLCLEKSVQTRRSILSSDVFYCWMLGMKWMRKRERAESISKRDLKYCCETADELLRDYGETSERQFEERKWISPIEWTDRQGDFLSYLWELKMSDLKLLSCVAIMRIKVWEGENRFY